MSKKITLFLLLLSNYLCFASANQNSYRWRNDDGTETSASWKAELNTISTSNSQDQPFRLRISLNETSGYGSTSYDVSRLAYSKNNGTNWVVITNNTTNDFYFINSSNVVNHSATTQQITSGPFSPGIFKSNADPYVVTISTSTITEVEYSIARSASYDENAIYQFRIDNVEGYSQYPLLKTQPATHLNFDGNDDYIQLTHFEKPNEFTIEAWVKNDYDTGNIISWGKNSNDTSHTKLRVDDGDIDFYIYDFINDISNTVSSSISINSDWHHIAVVKNTNLANNLEIYVDGALGATGTVNLNITSENLLIGGRSYNNLAPFELYEGNLDEVRIWNTARTATEINATKDCELLGNESGLLAYYTFNQGYDQVNNDAVTTLTNSVTGGSNGVLYNFNLYGTTSNWLSGSPVTSGVTCASLATSSFTSSEDVLLYPNPTSGFFNIGTEKESTITVYDVLGKEIILQNNNSKTIDLSHYSNGIYFVKIATLTGESSLHKLVKK